MIREMGLKAQRVTIALQKKHYTMDFDMGALANAECAYEDHFGKQFANISDIIGELFLGKTRALMALTFGAMISADEKIEWNEFSKNIFTFENYAVISDTVTSAVQSMMKTGDDIQENNPKNACSRGEN